MGCFLSCEDRLILWQALSDLFLDIDIDDVNYKYIACTVLESRFTLDEAEDILWYEVYPVLESNLKCVTGVWEGWSNAWLREHLPADKRPTGIKGDKSIINEIQHCWLKVTEQYNKKRSNKLIITIR